MKKVYFILLCLAIFSGCNPDPFTGYVVCKEYIPGHMDNKKVKPVLQAVIIPVTPGAHSRKHRPKWVKSRWVVYAANKSVVRAFSVDSLYFTNVCLGQKITIKH
jgi:hypothetical protein